MSNFSTTSSREKLRPRGLHRFLLVSLCVQVINFLLRNWITLNERLINSIPIIDKWIKEERKLATLFNYFNHWQCYPFPLCIKCIKKAWRFLLHATEFKKKLLFTFHPTKVSKIESCLSLRERKRRKKRKEKKNTLMNFCLADSLQALVELWQHADVGRLKQWYRHFSSWAKTFI